MENLIRGLALVGTVLGVIGCIASAMLHNVWLLALNLLLTYLNSRNLFYKKGE